MKIIAAFKAHTNREMGVLCSGSGNFCVPDDQRNGFPVIRICSLSHLDRILRFCNRLPDCMDVCVSLYGISCLDHNICACLWGTVSLDLLHFSAVRLLFVRRRCGLLFDAAERLCCREQQLADCFYRSGVGRRLSIVF